MENKDRLKILLVDDSRLCRMVLRAYFTPFNVDIQEAENGEKALNIMRDSKVELVILGAHCWHPASRGGPLAEATAAAVGVDFSLN